MSVKRRDLIKYFEEITYLLREGNKYWNRCQETLTNPSCYLLGLSALVESRSSIETQHEPAHWVSGFDTASPTQPPTLCYSTSVR